MWEFEVWALFVRYLSLGTFRKQVLYVHTFRTLYNSSTGTFMACLSYTPVNEKFNFRPKVSLTIMGKKSSVKKASSIVFGKYKIVYYATISY